MYELALPWLALRQAIRSNNSPVIEAMWVKALPWFLAKSKSNYASMCVEMTYFMRCISPRVAKVIRAHRTVSLRGNPGSNIALDASLENQNLQLAKACADSGRTPETLRGTMTRVNAINHVDHRVQSSFGLCSGAEAESDRVSKCDYDNIMADLLEHHAEDWTCFKQRPPKRRELGFKATGIDPEDKLKAAKKNLDNHVRKTLGKLVGS
mmetsp:Transcript_23276/g.72899  ORF Transcript_23276/g.72899 Transcript_23276/m.72899 type:complete len:209 (-) Transcript_23276:70-696(-)